MIQGFVFVLQGVVDQAVLGVDQRQYVQCRQGHRDDRGEDTASRPFVLGMRKGTGL